MIKLHARIDCSRDGEPIIARLTRNRDLPLALRSREAYLADETGSTEVPHGFAAIIAKTRPKPASCNGSLWVAVPPELFYLGPGDIVRINPGAGEIRVLYRVNSPHNSLFVTEQCNSNCIMCSQPPREVDDSYLVEDLIQAIPLMSPETRELGVTGGEPTLRFDGLCRLIVSCRDCLPATALHVLSNGRRFCFLDAAIRIHGLRHPDLMFGIPLYSDLADQHEFVVQAKGAFDETIRGILNLGRLGVRVEIRIVIHGQTYERLPELAEFIARNLPFVSHVAFMGLEMMGYVKMNLEVLWIDPVEYQPQLRRAVDILDRAGLNASIYNHQLCVLDRSLWPWARQSISDWKNEYLPQCDGCSVREACGGFFASATLRFSDYIRPLTQQERETT